MLEMDCLRGLQVKLLSRTPEWQEGKKCMKRNVTTVSNFDNKLKNEVPLLPSHLILLCRFTMYMCILCILIFFQRQVSLLSKFLLIAKCCYEQRNFATAMQILTGLENLIVRQLPVSLGLCSLAIFLNIILFQYRH